MRIPFVLYALALVVRVALIWHFPDPAYPDSFYYVDVARNLAAGHGFNIDLIWIFPEVGGTIPVDPILPIPSNAHWMPLASLVQVPFIWILCETPWASALPFALIGSLAAPLTWAMARDARAELGNGDKYAHRGALRGEIEMEIGGNILGDAVQNIFSR